MEPEVYFIRFAYPCSDILCRVRKEISKEEYESMEKAAVFGEKMNRDFLERVFHRAFERIEKLALEMKKDKWDLEVLEEYFERRHNGILDGSDYPESFKEVCKTWIGEIKSIEGKEGVVEYKGGKKRKVKLDYFENLGVGDKVWIHWQYAVKKLT